MKKSLAANLQFSGILYPFNRLLQKTKKEGKPSFFFAEMHFWGFLTHFKNCPTRFIMAILCSIILCA